MKKLILSFLLLVSIEATAQNNYFIESPSAQEGYLNVYFGANPIPYPVFTFTDTTKFIINTDTIQVGNINPVFNNLIPSKVINIDNNNYLGISNVSDIPLTFSQVTTGLGFTPTNSAFTITINGDSKTLAASRSWNVGDIVSSGSYSNPNWITSLAYSKLTGVPAFLTMEVDGSTTNELQTLSISNRRITLSSGGSVTVPQADWDSILHKPTINSGTVTSVGLSMPSAFSVSNSPITTSGTLTVTGAGTNSQVIDGTGALKTINTFTAYSSGTAYTLTTSSSKVDFGTNDPTITITSPGTYLITTNVRLEYSGLTTALNACTLKLRRTNNTASDLSNASTVFNVPTVTLLTGTGGDCDIPAIIYTTSNSNDVIEMWGNRSGGLTVGSILVGEASITAIKLY